MRGLAQPEAPATVAALPVIRDSTPIDGDREVRIALVLYGGVSLAIYIHGVTQELLRAVRATAAAKPGFGNQAPLLEDLSPTEAIYRELGRRAGSAAPFAPELDPVVHRRVHTRFVVDVISGTSAGGINGVFLAKALANDRSLSDLRTLWIEEGDLDLLLNDRQSVRDLPPSIRLERPPRALLNTRRLYYRLLEALGGLDRLEAGAVDSPLADEIDLYVTATDIRGLVQPIPLWDRAVYERRHRGVFHFLYAAARASGTRRNDFERENNGFLAFASRATSSFPIAFEPMTLADVAQVPPWNRDARRFAEDTQGWSGFYRDFVRAADGSTGTEDPRRFLDRAFGDGGYLDNKPFGYATDELRARRTDRRVLRKLVYIEPSPEHPELEADPIARPDPFENLASVFLLPREETIREDIERVLERNRVVAGVTEVVYRIDEDLRSRPDLPPLPRGAYARAGLAEMLARYGPGYATYHRAKVSQLTTEIAEVLMRLAGLDEESGLRLAVRELVRTWRSARYAPDLDERSPARLTENQLLVEFDLGYRVRRLQFLQERLDALLGVLGREERRLGDDLAERGRVEAVDSDPAVRDARQRRLEQRRQARDGERRDDLKKLDAILRGDVPPATWLGAPNRERLRGAVLALKDELAEIQVELRGRGRRVRTRRDDSPVVKAIADLRLSPAELQWILATPLEDAQRERATEVSTHPAGREERVSAVFAALAQELHEVFEHVRERTAEFFAKGQVPASPSPRGPEEGVEPIAIERNLRRSLEAHAVSFESYDSALFPLAWGTGVGELSCVDILRVSPDDTTLLRESDPRDGTRRFYKLAGTRFGSFGAFFDDVWRRSDILWGRLDGAERLVRSVLVARTDHDEAFAQQFIRRAQAAIVCEELRGLSTAECRRVLCQCLVRTTSGKAAPELLEEMMGKLLPEIARLSPEMAAILDPAGLREFYLERFHAERGLAPERGLSVFARATRIFGNVLDGLTERYGPISHRVGWWLLWIGRTLWALLEITLPRGWGALVTRYWLSLLTLAAIVLLLGGMLFDWPHVRALGIRTIAVLLVFDLLRRLIRALLQRRLGLRSLLIPVAVVVGVAGVWTLIRPIPGVAPWIDHQLTAVMDVFRPWLDPIWQLGKRLCPKC